MYFTTIRLFACLRRSTDLGKSRADDGVEMKTEASKETKLLKLYTYFNFFK